MTEEIIIDGVNVSECYADNKTMKDGLYCFWEGGRCEDNEYCYYKQLKRLEQENKKLKEENVKLLFGKGALINLCDNLTKIIDEKKEKESKLWQALEEIKAILDKECGVVSNAKVVGMINDVLQ